MSVTSISRESQKGLPNNGVERSRVMVGDPAVVAARAAHAQR